MAGKCIDVSKIPFFYGYVFATEQELKENPDIIKNQKSRIQTAVETLHQSTIEIAEEISDDTYIEKHPCLEEIAARRPELFLQINKMHRLFATSNTLILTNIDRISASTDQALHILSVLGIDSILFLDINAPDYSWTIDNELNLLKAVNRFVNTTVNNAKLEGRAHANRNPDHADGRTRTPENRLRIEEGVKLLEQGATYAQAALACGVSISTLTRERRKRKAVGILISPDEAEK